MVLAIRTRTNRTGLFKPDTTLIIDSDIIDKIVDKTVQALQPVS